MAHVIVRHNMTHKRGGIVTEEQVRNECRTQYRETGSLELPEKYRTLFHSQSTWFDEALKITKEELRSSMYG